MYWTLDEWQKVVDVNMTSVFYSIKAVVPIMKEQNYGRIVLVSSIGGRKGRPGVGVNYAASKAGLVGMTQLLGYGFGSGYDSVCADFFTGGSGLWN